MSIDEGYYIVYNQCYVVTMLLLNLFVTLCFREEILTIVSMLSVESVLHTPQSKASYVEINIVGTYVCFYCFFLY